MIVAFEGMDGCGKSTIANKVAKKLGYNYERQRLINLLNIDDNTYNKFIKMIRNSENTKLSFFFYSFRCMLDRDIKENTVIERTMMSTYYFEKEKIKEEEWNMIMDNPIMPDITFVLYASFDTRYKRIYNRNKSDKDLSSSEALADGYAQMLEFGRKYNIPYIGINTEIYSLEQIIEICVSTIKYYSQLDTKEEKDKLIKMMNDKYGVDDLYVLGGEKIERKLRFDNNRNGS